MITEVGDLKKKSFSFLLLILMLIIYCFFQTGKFRSKEDRADAELRQLLGSDISDVDSLQGTLPWRRTRRESSRFLGRINGNLTDGDDEILESLVKTATKGPTRTAPRERKRTRHADRKSCKYTIRCKNNKKKKTLQIFIIN